MLSELFSLFRGLQETGTLDVVYLFVILLSYAVLIFVCLPFHEFAHAFAAHKLGDDTAKWHGRLTLNPVKHLDTFGTLMLVLCGIGYARPVPINPYNFRKPKQGMALSALAGPLSNLLMAVAAVAIYRVICWIGGGLPSFISVGNQTIFMFSGSAAFYDIAYYSYVVLIGCFASINLGLAVFNLLPIPPLDGSRIFASILPDRWTYTLERYERYITIVLFVLLLTGALDTPLSYLHKGFGIVVGGLFGMPDIF